MVQERPDRVERRLSAILAADVAGYSRLMHDDEEATHARLTALLANGVNPAAWTPKGSGSSFELSPTLEPLAPYKDDLLVLSARDVLAVIG